MKPNELAEIIEKKIHASSLVSVKGRVIKALGTVIHGIMPGVKLGEMCLLRDPDTDTSLPCEVIGFHEDQTILTPIGEITGLSPRTQIIPLGRPHLIHLTEKMKGMLLSGMGRDLSAPDIPLEGTPCQVYANAPNPLQRTPISQSFTTGIKVVDGLLTVAKGQRLGLFAAPGVGKSTLISMLTKGCEADTIVLALIGERGREVGEFVDSLPEEVRKKAVIVVATSDKSPMERVKAAYVATTVAEFFRDKGENVLFLMDSITRFARSLREVGLSAGEPPTRRGYPPSIYQALPKLVERSGNSSQGSITAFYTVLIEGDDANDPIADEMASLLDGQFLLSRTLQQQGHYPAIDSLKSISRCMTSVISKDHAEDARIIKELFQSRP